jgi:hypothetical protein
MLSVVTWKWGTLYSADYINRLRNSLDRHLHLPFQLFCVTDDPTDIDARVNVLPMFPETFPDMKSPSGHRSNFRRLKTFDASLRDVFGPRTLLLDIDVVITGDVTPIFSRTEPLICFNQSHDDPSRIKLNPSVVLFDTGILNHMWQEFSTNPQDVWGRVRQSSIGDANNSDQAVLGYYAKDLHPLHFSSDDGIIAFYKVKNNDGGGLPPETRMVLFFGNDKPSDPDWQRKCQWITEHWRS